MSAYTPPDGRLWVVQVFNGRGWAKVRGPEGGPWNRGSRAFRIAVSRSAMPTRSSSTEGFPHRVKEVL